MAANVAFDCFVLTRLFLKIRVEILPGIILLFLLTLDLIILLGLFDFKKLPQIPALHTSLAAHAAAPQLQIPAAQTSPVVPFRLHGSGLQGSAINK